MMRETRSYYRSLKETLPRLGGVAFLGSRVIGKERTDSDLDTVFFYDFSDEWNGLPIKDHQVLIASTRYGEIYEEITTGLLAVLKKHGIKESGIDLCDISAHGLDSQIKTFASTPDLDEYPERRAFDQKNGTHTADSYGWEGTFLTRLFFLATGDGVYGARRYVLDRLQKLPQGELLFEILMDHLAYLSTKAGEYPTFQNLPRTIAEAKQYFLT